MNMLNVTALKEFHAITHELDLAKIRWWLEWGALLGAVRDGGIIEGDRDIDIGIDFHNSGKTKEVLSRAFLSPPYFVDLWFPERVLLKGKYWFIHYNRGQGWKQPEGRMAVKHMFPYKLYEPFKTIRFLDQDCLIPGQAEELLTYIYEDWSTVQKKYDVRHSDHKLYLDRKSRFLWKQDKLIKENYRRVKGE